MLVTLYVVQTLIIFLLLGLWLRAADNYHYYKTLWEGRPEIWESGD